MNTVAIGSLFLLVPLLSAQAPEMKPAAELKRFERLIGNFTGKGTAVMEPGKPPIEWTCQATYAWTLGNHFVSADTIVDFGSAMKPLAIRELIGWDRESNRYVAIGVNNEGEGSLNEVVFPNDDTMVQIVTKKAGGAPCAERQETTFTKDGMQFRITVLAASGAPFECVTGTFTRATNLKPVAVEASAAMEPAAEPVVKMTKAAGNYEVRGELVMTPGTAAMKITGTDHCRPIFGGTVLQTSTTGKADGSTEIYQAESFLVWNKAKQCFDQFGADNMGWIGAMEQRFIEGDKKILATCVAPYMGQMTTQRMVIDLDANGKFKKMLTMAMSGASEPYCSFKAEYSPVK
ncbi:MAG TPA: DUF1579 family protein [Planctomycetota bacterium]